MTYSDDVLLQICLVILITVSVYLIKNSQALKKDVAPKNTTVKKDLKSKVVAKK